MNSCSLGGNSIILLVLRVFAVLLFTEPDSLFRLAFQGRPISSTIFMNWMVLLLTSLGVVLVREYSLLSLRLATVMSLIWQGCNCYISQVILDITHTSLSNSKISYCNCWIVSSTISLLCFSSIRISNPRIWKLRGFQ